MMNQPEPQPVANNLPAVWDMVLSDMADRDQTGVEKYGTRLQPHNGRDALVDAYQEALDLVVYLRQTIFERDSSKLESESPYRFPETIFTRNAPFVQLEHIKSELSELVLAYDKEPIQRVAEETLDLIHSCETLLRILCQRQGIDVSALHDYVIEKNRQRGYY